MTQTSHVVLEDPRGEFWEGALVSLEIALVLRSRGVATLPIASALLARSSVGGYFKRAWGSGWPLSSVLPQMHCPMILWAAVGTQNEPLRRINFAARLVPDPEVLAAVRRGAKLAGAIRIAAESGQPGAFSGGLSPDVDTAVDANDLTGKLDEFDGWTVYGGANLNVPSDGFFAAAIYGSIPGLRVAWAAVSQSG